MKKLTVICDPKQPLTEVKFLTDGKSISLEGLVQVLKSNLKKARKVSSNFGRLYPERKYVCSDEYRLIENLDEGLVDSIFKLRKEDEEQLVIMAGFDPATDIVIPVMSFTPLFKIPGLDYNKPYLATVINPGKSEEQILVFSPENLTASIAQKKNIHFLVLANTNLINRVIYSEPQTVNLKTNTQDLVLVDFTDRPQDMVVRREFQGVDVVKAKDHTVLMKHRMMTAIKNLYAQLFLISHVRKTVMEAMKENIVSNRLS